LSPHFILYCLITLMVMFWSGNYIAAKIALREIPSVLLMCLRTLFAAILIVPVYWRQAKKNPPLRDWREAGLLAALGVLGITMNQFFWTTGVARTTVVHSSMIIGTTPLWVLAIAGMMRLERVTWPKLAGMAIALTGVGLLQFFRGGASAKGATLEGDLLVLLGGITLAAMTAAGKRYRPRSGGIALNAFAYVGGTIVLAPALWWFSRDFDFSRVSPAAWTAVLYMALFSSIGGYVIFYYALQHIPASRIAAFQYLQPVFASVMAMVLLGESLTAPAVAAGGMIFAGVYVTERFG
jgi:drug/metabolite transporter (DMT)-like permease